MYIGGNYSSYYNIYSKLMPSSGYTAQSSGNSSIYSYMNQLLNGNKSNSLTNNAVSAMNYVQTLKSSGTALKSAAAALSSGIPRATNAPTSSDSASLSVKASAGWSGSTDGLSVQIEQLASGQSNKGTALQASAKAGTGYHKFSIEIGGKTHNFTVSTNSADTNQSMQEKMAAAINAAGIGVTATVDKDSGKGTSALNLQSAGTGDNSKNVFRIKDISGSAVAMTGAGNTVQEAQDAKYSVNGERRSSSTNDVTLATGISATLKKAGEEAVTVSSKSGYDVEATKAGVQALVDSYNSLYSAAVNNSSDSKSMKLFSELVGVSKTYKSSLENIGIGFGSDGKMITNDKILTSAIENGSVSRFFESTGGKNYGFASRISQVADKAKNNTASYISKSSFSDSLFDFDTYLSVYSGALGKNSNASSLAGMLFNFSL